MLPGLVISTVALIAILWLVDIDQLVNALRLADYRLVALGFLFSVLWIIVRGQVWRTLLREQASFSQVFFSVTEGYLLNNILPFRLGEVGRSLLLSQKAGLNFWQVVSTVIIERILDLAFAAGLLLCTLPFVIGADWALQAAIGVGSIVLVVLAGLYLLAHNRQWALLQFERAAQRISVLNRLGQERLISFLNGLAVLNELSLFLRVIFWMVLNWSVAILQYYLFIWAFFPQPGLLWAVFSLGVMALGIAAPSSPGSVGVMELSVMGALAVFGVNPSTALALALTAHFSNYLISGVLGSYALARDGETLAGLYQRLRHISSTGLPAPK